MYVQVDLRTPAATSVELQEADDFRAFKLVVLTPDGRPDGLEDALRDVGSIGPDGDAFLRIDAVRRLAGDTAEDPAWTTAFDQMIGYARSRGWVAPDATLRAHQELRQGPA
ncbi:MULTISPECIES: hypothetical protein [Streptomyces]|uniref:hypothetical protein n=1 Tax=Streptomyces lycopersici TaxID=2974589 RepID=UPI0021CFC142|nr:hypothetical protein [Streptomyces sp. NEAU-383]